MGGGITRYNGLSFDFQTDNLYKLVFMKAMSLLRFCPSSNDTTMQRKTNYGEKSNEFPQ